MSRANLRYMLGVYVACQVGIWGAFLIAQPAAEGSWGWEKIPPIVGMTEPCPGFVLATGEIDAAPHEEQDGYFAIGGVSLAARPNSAAVMRLRTERGKSFDLVLRPVTSRELQKVER